MERILSLNEARVGYRPRDRHPPNERAHVLPGDPDFLHWGPTRRLKHHGESVDFFTIGAVALALNRTVGTVRRLETEGILPETPFRAPGRTRAGQKRLYTRDQVLAVARVAEEYGIAIAKRTDDWLQLKEAIAAAMTDSASEHWDHAREMQKGRENV